MLKIRLKRTGRKKKPFYKIVLMESLFRRDGKAIRELGYYDPILKKISVDRYHFYQSIQQGAYPTNTVRHLICKLLESNQKSNGMV
jgi:small subunit ribosomal protein S16